ncbi:angiotensin-converting enzyme-like, partial [Rhagoletis pomonella]|uniref:angiotensin-converting enzyme-like n=1 Tax=Rhagoletis pomonella TaxID=28610 RepID=UPI001781FFBE
MKIFITTFLLSLALQFALASVKEEITATEYIENLNKEIARRNYLERESSWAYASNINDENERQKNEVAADVAKFMKEAATDLQKFNWQTFKSENLRRQFKKLTKLEYAALSEADYAEYLSVMSTMESNFARVRVCDYKNATKCDLSLDPEIQDIISTSRDPEELKYYWREFYDKAGTAVREPYEKYVELNTKAAKLNNFTSGA